jgi:hypothetical protein
MIISAIGPGTIFRMGGLAAGISRQASAATIITAMTTASGTASCKFCIN